MSEQPANTLDYGQQQASKKIGYAGQRFMAICKTDEPALPWVILGFTWKDCGGVFRKVVQQHATWTRLVVLDLDMDSIQLGVKLSTLPGCQLGLEHLRAACMNQIEELGELGKHRAIQQTGWC